MEKLTVLDLELTDTDIDTGARIVSLGAVRLGRTPSEDIGREWFFNPGDREISAEATAIHGLTKAFLSTQPTFREKYFDIALFLGNSTIVHHCWYRKSDDRSVDERALNAEFMLAGHAATPHDRWVNLKKIAQILSPDANSLNDMMDRYGISRSRRGEKHGALNDTVITAAIFRKMTEDPDARRPLRKLGIR